jgi:hypothetical protein
MRPHVNRGWHGATPDRNLKAFGPGDLQVASGGRDKSKAVPDHAFHQHVRAPALR